eukprot:446163-Rhodomonas_salina.4
MALRSADLAAEGRAVGVAERGWIEREEGEELSEHGGLVREVPVHRDHLVEGFRVGFESLALIREGRGSLSGGSRVEGRGSRVEGRGWVVWVKFRG